VKPETGTALGAQEHAVVIGASFAGLMCARVLADHFKSVTLIERDVLSDVPEPRKGVAQSRQTHGVTARGTQEIERLFPGFWEELVATHGVVAFNGGTDLLWYQSGGWKVRVPGPTGYGLTRPLLEYSIRRRLLQDRPHVSVRVGDVKGLVHDASQHRVTGVHLRDQEGQESVVKADLVVDGSGRGTRIPRWLKELGYGHTPEEHVGIDMGYATRIVEAPRRARDWKGMLVYGKAPHQKRLGYIFPIEGGRWYLTLGGYHGDHPPSDDEGFLEFARTVHHPAYFATMKDARPLSPISVYKMPSSQRYYYERMPHFPEGLIVAGDAICSFNPIFGQGITTAVLGAVALQESLDAFKAHPSKKFSRDFQKRTARYNDVAWALASGEDLRYPQTQGKRSLGQKLLHWYTGQLMELCSVDEEVQKRALVVQHMLAGPEKLMSPVLMLKALRWGLGLRGKRTMLVDPPSDTVLMAQVHSLNPELPILQEAQLRAIGDK
jgi:2-polyprenyl-6-methoxyphenol hydroxylase-like FAD-dependent oxidoreductase